MRITRHVRGTEEETGRQIVQHHLSIKRAQHQAPHCLSAPWRLAKPKLMLLDEPSLGLAPLLVQSIFEIIRQVNKETGVSILLVEQNANVALKTASKAYVMENGRIVLDGTAEQLSENADIKEFYLGLGSSGERKSYRDVKHYKRRKRWLG